MYSYLRDTQPEFKILGGASKISVCFSGNTSNCNLTPGQKQSDQEILVCLTFLVNSTVLVKLLLWASESVSPLFINVIYREY